MNLGQLRKYALMTAQMKANPKSRFAHLHPIVQERLVNSVYNPDMSDDELFKAIANKIVQHPMPKNPTKEAAVSQLDYEKSYDELIAPNRKLEAEADKILAANPEKITGDTEEIFNPTEFDYMYDEDLIPNMIVERLNAQKAREYDDRYRKAYAIYDRQHYQPTMGRVTHIRKNSYKPLLDNSSRPKIPFDERYTNMEDPFAGGIDTVSDIGSGIPIDKYRQFLDYVRSIK